MSQYSRSSNRMSMSLITRIFIICIFTTLFSHASISHADDVQINEQLLKPAVVYNIFRYVVWPKSVLNVDDIFSIGIFGQPRGLNSWNSLNGKVTQGHKIRVRHISDPDDLVNCHAVFIESSEVRKMTQILSKLRNHPVLTIISSDNPASGNDAMIVLQIINNRQAFSVNLKNVHASNLEMSSYLLRLATEVVK